MQLYSKIVLTSQEPSQKNILWANPDTNELKYWSGAMWESFFTKKGGEFKQDKYDNKLLTNRKDVVGAINENVESIQKVGERISNIDLSFVAKEATLVKESQILQEGISSVEGKVQEVRNDIKNIDLSSVESKVEEEADSIEAKIDEIVTAYNNGQEIIDQMVAIQLQTIIGDENT